MYLRNVLNTLARDRKFNAFVELPDRSEFPEYYSGPRRVAVPVSIDTMHDKNDQGL